MRVSKKIGAKRTSGANLSRRTTAKRGTKKMKNVAVLVEHGLMNRGLVPLTETLIERYNACLVSMGFEPTLLTDISVDGVGWSPEVAREKGTAYYLCNDFANPVAIIVSPEQYKKPVFAPVFSWMRGCIRVFFEKHHREIIDITSTDVISIDFENGISEFVGPEDLLLLSEITARPNVDRLTEAAQEQQTLITHVMEGLNCLDTPLRHTLRAHRVTNGDLRRRKCHLEPVTFDLFKDFWTIAFDGAAVLRGVGGRDMLILDSEEMYRSIQTSARADAVDVCYLYDSGHHPFKLLREAGMIELPLAAFQKDPKILEEKKALLLALSLCDAEVGLEWSSLTQTRRKTVMKQYKDKVPQLFGQLERFAAALARGTALPILSEELAHFLMVPSANLPPGTQEVLWVLLTRKDERRILEAYTYDKNRFIANFSRFSSQKQKWVADYLAVHYVPRMSLP